jgi:hypothetical protein
MGKKIFSQTKREYRNVRESNGHLQRKGGHAVA